MVCPARINLGYTRASLLSQANKAEHLVQYAVAAVAFASLNSQLRGDAHQSWIAKAEHVRAFDYQHRGTIRVICMHQRIGKGFT